MQNLNCEKQEVKKIIFKKTINNLYPQKINLITNQVKKGNQEIIVKIIYNIKIRIRRFILIKKNQTIAKKAKSQFKKISQGPIENKMQINNSFLIQ